MSTSNIVSLNDNPLDHALLVFGIHGTAPAKEVKALSERGDVTLAHKFFRPLQEYLEYAELTPQGLHKWTDLENSNILFRSEGGENDIGDPASKEPDDRLLFEVDRIQDYVSEGLDEELLLMTHTPYRKSKGLGGNG